MKPSNRTAFTLIELLVAIIVIGILVAIIMPSLAFVRERASRTAEVSQMKQITVGILAHAVDNEAFYSTDDVGNSAYRSFDDPLGLPQLLKKRGFGDEKIWLSPRANDFHKRIGNSFAWTRNSSICGRPISTIEKPSATLLLYHNYCFTLPSTKNAFDGGTTGGPRTASQTYWVFPYERGTSAPQAFADGHVEVKSFR